MLFTTQLVLAVIIGGMVVFQVLYAPIVFIKLENGVARRFIRAFFPYYYLFFGGMTAVLLCMLYVLELVSLAALAAACLAGFIISRQYLMKGANRASDAGNKPLFNIYHRTSVVINTMQMFCFIAMFYWIVN